MIHIIKDDSGNWINSIEGIKAEAENFYKKQLNGTHPRGGLKILDSIPNMINESTKIPLEAFPTMEELFDTIKSIEY